MQGFPWPAFRQFLLQNPVQGSQILEARVLSDAYMNNPNSISFIYGFVC